MNENPSPTATSGESVLVAYRDGRTELVRIQQIGISRLLELARTVRGKHVMADVVCGRGAGWSRTLWPASFARLVAVTQAQNRRAVIEFMARYSPNPSEPSPLAPPQ
jgi:hypothetical protein